MTESVKKENLIIIDAHDARQLYNCDHPVYMLDGEGICRLVGSRSDVSRSDCQYGIDNGKVKGYEVIVDTMDNKTKDIDVASYVVEAENPKGAKYFALCRARIENPGKEIYVWDVSEDDVV